MPLHHLLQNEAFEPLHIEAMVFAFEAICLELKLHDRPDDPLREVVAIKIIELAKRGERDPIRLRDQVLAIMKG